MSGYRRAIETAAPLRELYGLFARDLSSAWAVGGQARLLHRRGTVWTRIPLDPSAQGPLVAVRARREGITVLAEDGMVLEGPGSTTEPVGSPSGTVDLRGGRFGA